MFFILCWKNSTWNEKKRWGQHFNSWTSLNNKNWNILFMCDGFGHGHKAHTGNCFKIFTKYNGYAKHVLGEQKWLLRVIHFRVIEVKHLLKSEVSNFCMFGAVSRIIAPQRCSDPKPQNLWICYVTRQWGIMVADGIKVTD